MAKGRAKHDEYKDALSLLGKDLARRAGRKCELTGESGRLLTYDLEEARPEPELDEVVLVCEKVIDHLEGRNLHPNELHYLNEAVWSSEKPVRRAAIRILEQIDEPWAQDAIDNARMMDENEQED